MKASNLVLAVAALVAVLLCAGCIGEGETEFRPTPGVINVGY